ncbi:hypothetical protein GYMLUDRAFT_52706 [Collybiopsis luxurians FD-317 M1]|nr:hypothetical protein GYMLUDRAFT_52706 [Collybiopsis luxurians FD-317 M1]
MVATPEKVSSTPIPPELASEMEALTDPSESTFFSPVRKQSLISSWTSWVIFDAISPPSEGYTSFKLNEESHIYDSGTTVRISYERNPDFPECPENEALDSEDGSLARSDVEKVLSIISKEPGWDRSSSPIQVAYKTVGLNEAPEITYKPAVNPDLDRYPDMPHLSLPIIPLRNLRRKFNSRIAHIDLVALEDDNYSTLHVCKVARRLDESSTFASELSFLAGMSESSFLIRPSAMVVDDERSLRGYLVPYHPASSLRDVFGSRHSETVTLFPSPNSRLTDNICQPISWKLRMIWATDVASALAFLHRQDIYWGDLKNENVVLCRDGHCRLIDYFPDGYTPSWCPPEMKQIADPDTFVDHLQAMIRARTPQRDVFSLGLVLWAIAEEISNFEREPEFSLPIPTWTLRAAVPQWYRDLVSMCLIEEVHERPTALDVLKSLTSHF